MSLKENQESEIKKQEKRNNNKREYLDITKKHNINIVAMNMNNTEAHEVTKAKFAYKLMKDGYEVITEAIFKNGKRADIFVSDNANVYEILASETIEMADKKTAEYPVPAANIHYVRLKIK